MLCCLVLLIYLAKTGVLQCLGLEKHMSAAGMNDMIVPGKRGYD